MKTKSIPPKGWPVWVKGRNNGDWVVRISLGMLSNDESILCCYHQNHNISIAWETWKPYKLPNGKLLKWPESKGKKK